MTYATDRLWEEVVYVAYYLHWSTNSVLGLEHPTRRRVIEEIGRINQHIFASNDSPAHEEVSGAFPGGGGP
ncbi:DUF6760 family protein [Streptomyces sp. NPDC019539]|uniref:DUF6760 family protein n=1 Tax=Streptomyces sp. NPDC019539 TaxID=3365063 RepID=UPI0037BDA10C